MDTIVSNNFFKILIKEKNNNLYYKVVYINENIKFQNLKKTFFHIENFTNKTGDGNDISIYNNKVAVLNIHQVTDYWTEINIQNCDYNNDFYLQAIVKKLSAINRYMKLIFKR